MVAPDIIAERSCSWLGDMLSCRRVLCDQLRAKLASIPVDAIQVSNQ